MNKILGRLLTLTDISWSLKDNEMPENKKWRKNWKINNPSFDDPKCLEPEEQSKEVSKDGILSILGQNIGLISRKHKRENKKCYEPSNADKKENSSKLSFSNILKFEKSRTPKIKSKLSTDEKNIINNNNNTINTGLKQQKIHPTRNDKSRKTPSRKSSSPKNTFETREQFSKSTNSAAKSASKAEKSAVQKKTSRQRKLTKSHSDSSLNVTKGKVTGTQTESTKTSRCSSSASSTRCSSTTVSRCPSASTSRCSSRTLLTSTTSSIQSTPKVHKKNKKKILKKQNKTESKLPSPDTEQKQSPPLFINYRYQVSLKITFLLSPLSTQSLFLFNTFL